MVDILQVKLRYAAYAEAGGETTIDAADAAQIVELCEMCERSAQAARDAVRPMSADEFRRRGDELRAMATVAYTQAARIDAESIVDDAGRDPLDAKE